MQAHHICRFSSLGPACSKKIIYRAGPWRMLPEERDGVWSLDPWIRQRIGFDRSVVIDEENYYTMCEGRSKLLKFVKAHVFGWTQLDQNVDDREFHSVRGYISHLRNFEKVKAQDFRCGRNYCDECRRARFYVSNGSENATGRFFESTRRGWHLLGMRQRKSAFSQVIVQGPVRSTSWDGLTEESVCEKDTNGL